MFGARPTLLYNQLTNLIIDSIQERQDQLRLDMQIYAKLGKTAEKMSNRESEVAQDPVKPKGRTLGAIVEFQIEQDIIDGVYRPGDRLDEKELAERLSTSRTPIREALRKLAASDLVTIHPRSGARVSRPNMAEIIELFEVISALEGFAAKLAATRATEDQLAAIKAAHETCEELALSGDAKEYFDANGVFHRSIWKAANNYALIDQITAVDKRLAPYRRQITFHPGRKQNSRSEHAQIAKALAERQPEIAEKAMLDHVMILSDDALQLARDLRL
ncbi:GntR family transcriptional regulator [Rhodobacterales bacterium]|nr:GntR family transcriptional regulator [Rhodobacterales bacterium]